MRIVIAAGLATLLAACASYDGRGLVPGQSTVAEVESTMGRPAERITNAAGEKVLFYPRAPMGRHTYAARIDADDTLIAVEQRLTNESFARVIPGKTLAAEVHELLGPPWQVTRLPRQQRDVWDYRAYLDYRYFNFFVQLSDDGVVREAYLLHDPMYDVGSGRR